VLTTEDEEIKAVGTWLAEQSKAGVLPHEFGVFVRSAAQLDRARAVVKKAGLPFKILDEQVETARRTRLSPARRNPPPRIARFPKPLKLVLIRPTDWQHRSDLPLVHSHRWIDRIQRDERILVAVDLEPLEQHGFVEESGDDQVA